jgi:hypothetical protein
LQKHQAIQTARKLHQQSQTIEEMQREAIKTAQTDQNKGLEYWLNCQSESKKQPKVHNKIYREVES